MYWQYRPIPYAKTRWTMNRIEWSDVQVFDAVREGGSIGAAARRLGVNHSTVLRRIAALEATLGVRLFDRLPRGYALTAEGHEFAAGVAGVSEQLEAAQRRVSNADRELRGRIRITAPETLAQIFLVPLLAEFQSKHPQVQLELVTNDLFFNLTQREADVALRGSNEPPENLVGRRVGTLQTALYASKAYLETVTGRDPARLRWVAPDASLSHLGSAKWIAAHVAPENIALRVGSLAMLAQAVAAGVGAGWLLCPVAGTLPDLDRIAPPRAEFDTDVWVLSHPDLRQVARIRALTEFLYARLSSDARLRHV